MTWTFAYFMVLLIGLVLAGASGLFRSVRFLGGHHRHLVVPHPDHCLPFRSHAARFSVGFTVLGLIGLLLSDWQNEPDETTLIIAVAASVAATLLAFLLIRRAVAGLARHGQATVVRDIAPGGYGQICFGSDDGGLMMAARSSSAVTIPAGTRVEVIETEHSVVTVRLLQEP